MSGGIGGEGGEGVIGGPSDSLRMAVGRSRSRVGLIVLMRVVVDLVMVMVMAVLVRTVDGLMVMNKDVERDLRRGMKRRRKRSSYTVARVGF